MTPALREFVLYPHFTDEKAGPQDTHAWRPSMLFCRGQWGSKIRCTKHGARCVHVLSHNPTFQTEDN